VSDVQLFLPELPVALATNPPTGERIYEWGYSEGVGRFLFLIFLTIQEGLSTLLEMTRFFLILGN